jgi:bacterioferritin (cytochrome b1)
MADQSLIDDLNEYLSLEYASVIQLMQHSYVLQGLDREPIAALLRGHATESMGHIGQLGDKIVALGGVPTVEVGPVEQSTDTEEMLRQDRDQHHFAVQKLEALIRKTEPSNVPLRVMLEEMVWEEQTFAEKIDRLLAERKVGSAQQPVVRTGT